MGGGESLHDGRTGDRQGSRLPTLPLGRPGDSPAILASFADVGGGVLARRRSACSGTNEAIDSSGYDRSRAKRMSYIREPTTWRTVPTASRLSPRCRRLVSWVRSTRTRSPSSNRASLGFPPPAKPAPSLLVVLGAGLSDEGLEHRRELQLLHVALFAPRTITRLTASRRARRKAPRHG